MPPPVRASSSSRSSRNLRVLREQGAAPQRRQRLRLRAEGDKSVFLAKRAKETRRARRGGADASRSSLLEHKRPRGYSALRARWACLNHAEGEHGVGDLLEAGDVGALHIVHGI